MIYGNSVGGVGLERTYILVDDKGNEYPATFVDNETDFDATPNDIRLGKTAATNVGVTVGEKDIPGYRTVQGRRPIKNGDRMSIPLYSDMCQYTKLQVIICDYNNSVKDSFAAVLVVIEDKVYEVGSHNSIATVTVDMESQSIDIGIDNDRETTLVLRYMIIKEDP